MRRLKHHFVELPDINVELCVGHNEGVGPAGHPLAMDRRGG